MTADQDLGLEGTCRDCHEKPGIWAAAWRVHLCEDCRMMRTMWAHLETEARQQWR